jgi:hypothetical protein
VNPKSFDLAFLFTGQTANLKGYLERYLVMTLRICLSPDTPHHNITSKKDPNPNNHDKSTNDVNKNSFHMPSPHKTPSTNLRNTKSKRNQPLINCIHNEQQTMSDLNNSLIVTQIHTLLEMQE